MPGNPLQMGCLQCLIAVSERELFLFKGRDMNYLCNWHRYDITVCQSEILFVLDFNTFISSAGHLNKLILLKWCFLLVVLRVPSACAGEETAVWALCVPRIARRYLLYHHQALTRGCRVCAEPLTCKPWPEL